MMYQVSAQAAFYLDGTFEWDIYEPKLITTLDSVDVYQLGDACQTYVDRKEVQEKRILHKLFVIIKPDNQQFSETLYAVITTKPLFTMTLSDTEAAFHPSIDQTRQIYRGKNK